MKIANQLLDYQVESALLRLALNMQLFEGKTFHTCSSHDLIELLKASQLSCHSEVLTSLGEAKDSLSKTNLIGYLAGQGINLMSDFDVAAIAKSKQPSLFQSKHSSIRRGVIPQADSANSSSQVDAGTAIENPMATDAINAAVKKRLMANAKKRRADKLLHS